MESKITPLFGTKKNEKKGSKSVWPDARTRSKKSQKEEKEGEQPRESEGGKDENEGKKEAEVERKEEEEDVKLLPGEGDDKKVEEDDDKVAMEENEDEENSKEEGEKKEKEEEEEEEEEDFTSLLFIEECLGVFQEKLSDILEEVRRQKNRASIRQKEKAAKSEVQKKLFSLQRSAIESIEEATKVTNNFFQASPNKKQKKG